MLPIEDDTLTSRRSMTTTENDDVGSAAAVNGRGNGTALAGYPFKYRNCRRSKLPKPVVAQQQQQHQKYPSEEMLYNEPNLVPKMELLKINYFNVPRKSTVQLKQMTSRSRSSVQDIKEDLIRKCGGRGREEQKQHRSSSSAAAVTPNSPLGRGCKSIKVPEVKYAVYKKHNLQDDQHRVQPHHRLASAEKDSKVFDFDNVKFRKKYFLFDSKKRSKKLDNIQFYFDNKSYERHVDNKLYGSAQRPMGPPSSSTHYLQSGSMNRRENHHHHHHQQHQQLTNQPQQSQNLQPPSKLSTWKDHLNNTRLGNVRELQHKYENRARQSSGSEPSGAFRLHQKHRVTNEGDERRERQSSTHVTTDTDKLIKSNSGTIASAYRRPDDRSTNTNKNKKRPQHHPHHHQSGHSTNMCKRRESTTENESNKIKRLVEGFEKKSPATKLPESGEGRENFILFQRVDSEDNHLMASSNSGQLNGSATPIGTAADTGDLKSNAMKRRSDSKYHQLNGNNSSGRQQPLCKNIRTPRPTSMPVNGSNSSQLAERMDLMMGRSIKHCGYKNCQFQNCPMTGSSSSTSSGCDSSSCSTISRKSDRKCTSPINIVHRNQSAEENKASLDCPLPGKSLVPKSRTERISNIKQLERRIVTKYISDELRLLSNTARDELDDGYEPISPCRDSEADFESNKVKIYVGGTFTGQKQFVTEQLEDSDKDYGYYDQVTADSGSSEHSYGSIRASEMEKVQPRPIMKDPCDESLVNIMEMSSDLMGKLGCDGAIFWNENCYEEECKVQCAVKEPYVCVCGSSSKVQYRLRVNLGQMGTL